MRRTASVLLLLAASTASAQTQPPATPDVEPGEQVRVTLAPGHGAPLGARSLLTGRVAHVTPDTLGLIGDAGPTRVAWADISVVERRAESRGREGLGMLAGTVIGGLAGAALGPVIAGDPLGIVYALPAALVGLVVGGTAGARAGETWRPVR